MPFMKGSSPIRRTAQYLKSGKVIFREAVKIFSINFNFKGEHHRGARDFVFWHLSQIQYKNPKVQCQTLPNFTPTPFIRIYFEDAKSVLIDIDSREKEEILDHLINFTAVCKTEKELILDNLTSKENLPLSYFGYGCERHCICEVMGQVPCSSVVVLPSIMRRQHHNPELRKEFRIPPCYLKGLGTEINNEN